MCFIRMCSLFTYNYNDQVRYTVQNIGITNKQSKHTMIRCLVLSKQILQTYKTNTPRILPGRHPAIQNSQQLVNN